MPSLAAIQKLFPTAGSCGGTVGVLHEGRNIAIGQIVGDDMVVLTAEGERVMAEVADVVKPKRGRRAAAADDTSTDELPAEDPAA